MKLAKFLYKIKEYSPCFISIDVSGEYKAIKIDEIVNAISNSNYLVNKLVPKTVHGKNVDEYINDEIIPKLQSDHTHVNIDVLNQITPEKINEWNNKVDNVGTFEYIQNKNQPNGYAGLDDNGKILADQMPSLHRENAIVSTIEERDQLTGVYKGMLCIVQKTLNSKGEQTPAVFIASTDSGDWIKIAQNFYTNSIPWDSIEGRPTSQISDIDTATSKRHDHTNKNDILDKFTIGDDNQLRFDGKTLHYSNIPVQKIKYRTYQLSEGETVLQSSNFLRDNDILLGIYIDGRRLVENVHYTVDSHSITLMHDYDDGQKIVFEYQSAA